MLNSSHTCFRTFWDITILPSRTGSLSIVTPDSFFTDKVKIVSILNVLVPIITMFLIIISFELVSDGAVWAAVFLKQQKPKNFGNKETKGKLKISAKYPEL